MKKLICLLSELERYNRKYHNDLIEIHRENRNIGKAKSIALESYDWTYTSICDEERLSENIHVAKWAE
jgi:hypothetical protein